jgi:hypothetical protein
VYQYVKLRIGQGVLKYYPVLGSVDRRLARGVPLVIEELVNAPLSPLSECDIETHE